MPHARRRWLLPMGALLVLSGLAGCSREAEEPLGSLGPAQRPGSTAPAGSGSNAQTAQEQAVAAAYRAFWDDMVAVSATSDRRSPRLDDHATGRVLAQWRQKIAVAAGMGTVARGAPKLLDPTVTKVEGATATVSDCLDSNQWLYHDAKTGELRDKASGKLVRVAATLRLDGSVWKVSELDLQEAACGG